MSSFDFEPLFPPVHVVDETGGTVRTDVWIPTHVELEVPTFLPTQEEAGSPATIESVRRNLEAQLAAQSYEHELALADALQQGIEQGRAAGEAAERARLRGAMAAAESAFDDLRAGEARWLTNVEENVAAIAIAVAHQIIGREVSATQDVVLSLVTRAVQEFALDQPLAVRVNPGDLANLQSSDRDTPGDFAQLSAEREMRWVADARIERGGCVVEGRERIIDGRVDTGLERLYRRLTHTNA
jgi:flagellar assembly protein FliH